MIKWSRLLLSQFARLSEDQFVGGPSDTHPGQECQASPELNIHFTSYYQKHNKVGHTFDLSTITNTEKEKRKRRSTGREREVDTRSERERKNATRRSLEKLQNDHLR